MPDDAPESPAEPCPFCGGRPRFTERACTPSERSPTGRIYFLACMCGGHSARAHQFGYSREDVVAAWNRRPAHPDTRRIDLVERHSLDIMPTDDGWAVVADIADVGFGSTARDAIDAAGKVLEPDSAPKGASGGEACRPHGRH